MSRPVPYFLAHSLAALLLCAAATCWTSRVAYSCPWGGVAPTFAEEMGDAHVVAIVTLRERPADPGPEIPGVELDAPKATFEIERVFKGDALAKPAQVIEVDYSGNARPGDRFFLMAVNEPPLTWLQPVPLTMQREAYLSQVSKLVEDAKTRIHFFHSYLQDPDEMLAGDAFDELQKFDFRQLVQLKGALDHDRLVAGIKNKETRVTHRRLLLRLLGICGNKQDVPLLEAIIHSEDPAEKRGIEAVLACYLALKGTDGVPLIEERFLKNKAADYAETYAGIMALRSEEAARIPQQRRVEALRLMLDRPELADLVIPDLARLDDWHQLDRLFAMYKTSVAADGEEKSGWIRVPIINYLRECPLPKARDLLLECQRLDPKAMKRAKTFQPGLAPKPRKFAKFRPYRPGFSLLG